MLRGQGVPWMIYRRGEGCVQASFMLPLKSGSDPPFLLSVSLLYQETWAKSQVAALSDTPVSAVPSSGPLPNLTVCCFHTVQSTVKPVPCAHLNMNGCSITR